MKLSIIIPTYNEEEYLPKLLDSIVSQDFTNYEIIVADASSKDKTVEIAKSYGCKVVEGGMPGVGRNKGAEVASGKIFLFLDSDLVLTENYLSNTINEFEKKELGIGITQMIPSSGKLIDRLLHSLANYFMIAVENIKPHGAGCYGLISKADLHQKVKGFDETLSFGEDTDYIERIAKISKFKVVRSGKLIVSTRRIEEQGLLKLISQYGKSTINDFIGKRTTAKELGYDFGHYSDKNVIIPKKILYSVCGEGMGHAIRSGVIIEELNKNHTLLIFASDRSYHYLNSKFDNVYEISGFNTVYENNEVRNKQTFMNALKSIPSDLKENYNILYKKAREFKPNIIISDFENYASMLSTLINVPMISVDNIHMITQSEIDYPPKNKRDMITAKSVIRSYIVLPKRYILTSYFYPKLKNPKKAVIYPPVLREEIRTVNGSYEGYIFVYQTSSSNLKLVDILKESKNKFVVYGFDKEGIEDNLFFKKFNETEFFEDLGKADAVISNGGFTLLSESIYLKKPIYTIPATGNFEQTLNAFYIDKLGYGEMHNDITTDKIENFLKNRQKYIKNLEKYQNPGNQEIIKELEDAIETYAIKNK
ncbi:MAG: MJ1255/VC2487 family glycosyltransferase [Methanobacteriaceae archaeon]